MAFVVVCTTIFNIILIAMCEFSEVFFECVRLTFFFKKNSHPLCCVTSRLHHSSRPEVMRTKNCHCIIRPLVGMFAVDLSLPFVFMESKRKPYLLMKPPDGINKHHFNTFQLVFLCQTVTKKLPLDYTAFILTPFKLHNREGLQYFKPLTCLQRKKNDNYLYSFGT
jgi:hypothetical protein